MEEEKKKVLIISMTAGFGHIRAGEALLDYAKEYLPTIHAEHIDVVDINSKFKKYGRLYHFASNTFPLAWKLIYQYAFLSFVMKKIITWIGVFDHSIEDYIAKKSPDVIIFTNGMVPTAINFFYKNIFQDKRIGVVVTDYHAHPYYKFDRVDYYFVPHLQVKEDLQALGIAKEKIIITGIPINPRFYIPQNLPELKKKYGINSNLPVVLLIASFKISQDGLGMLVSQLLAYDPAINLVVIANGNEAFYATAKSFQKNKQFLLVNWTNQMEEYIAMADVVITKAGGLTVSECIAMQKPMIIVSPIPGQEEYNAAFIEKNNFGVQAKKIDDIFIHLPKTLSWPKKNQMELISQKNPCKEILEKMVS